MSLYYDGRLTPRAREMRRDMTRQEEKLWCGFLRSFPIRFQRQKVIGHFIVDFYCHEAGLAIEVDGGQHYSDYGMAYDAERSAVLERYGVEVLRFSNLDVDRKFGAVCEMIGVKVEERMGAG